jgi:uroporphyrinogen III methyltransferase/synthase
MTIDGLNALKNAEVVVYDKLLGEGVYDLIPTEAEKINAGKESSNHLIPQEEINNILVAKAREGKRVVRLKGGDSYLFGRGGEEVEALCENGIPFKVISGVSSSIAAPAYAGIPVTHRACASSVHIITGHNKKGTPLNINFKACVEIGGTLVFLMGVKNLAVIVNGLTSAGMSEDMPCAVVENGASPKQRKVVSTLKDIAEAAKDMKSPSVIVVGEVCRYSDKLDWYSKLPLKGKRIVAARPKDRAEALVNKLRANGASVELRPCISTEPINADILGDIESSEVVAFTSLAGVDVTFKLLAENNRDARAFGGKKIAAIGKKTALELLKHGIKADIIPQKHNGESFAEELAASGCSNILLLRAENGARELTEALKKMGISYKETAVYRTVIDTVAADEVEDTDYIVFASPSEVKGFAEVEKNYTAVCIGCRTASEAEKHSLKYIVSESASDDGIVDAIIKDVKNG